MVNCKQPCDSCAFTHGAAANRELTNHLRGQICLLGPLPFLCHHGKDWGDSTWHRTAPGKMFRQGWRICEGWRRAVNELAKTGYYGAADLHSKPFAQIAITELEITTSRDVDDEDKAEAAEMLAKALAHLYKQLQEFTGRDLGEEVSRLAEEGYFAQEEREIDG